MPREMQGASWVPLLTGKKPTWRQSFLAEYFYEDWGKVRAALNDTGAWFVAIEKLAAPPMMQEEGEERSRYAINKGDIPIEGYLAASELA